MFPAKITVFFFFFFKQKTAYEIGVRLVGSGDVYKRQDLLCFDSIDQLDPEAMNSSYPATRSIHVGLSVGF